MVQGSVIIPGTFSCIVDWDQLKEEAVSLLFYYLFTPYLVDAGLLTCSTLDYGQFQYSMV